MLYFPNTRKFQKNVRNNVALRTKKEDKQALEYANNDNL